jgi:hypothetical protein
MRSALVLSLATAVMFGSPAGAAQNSAPQDPHAAMNHRGATVMGFDQAKTTHHFLLFEDGGAIDVSAKSASDTTNRDAIRAHLPHIVMSFGQGNFDSPFLVHDTKKVPGTAAMAELKTRITYTYVETPPGGRVDIKAADPAAIKAVHEFLRFQITDHKTGDSLAVRKR